LELLKVLPSPPGITVALLVTVAQLSNGGSDGAALPAPSDWAPAIADSNMDKETARRTAH
jgi:hypothetical protein